MNFPQLDPAGIWLGRVPIPDTGLGIVNFRDGQLEAWGLGELRPEGAKWRGTWHRKGRLRPRTSNDVTNRVGIP